MSKSLELFRAIRWNNTQFRILSRSDEAIEIEFDKISVAGQKPQKKTVRFVRPREEWISVWNPSAKEWTEHPDREHPIGDRIEKANAKGFDTLIVSFGGHHKLGVAQWGFWADEMVMLG